jgi:hypothetical protein
MSESLKVVNPPEVLAYGTRVNSRVDEMFTELNTLSQNCVDVDYEGTNAFAFKTEAGTKAVEFGKALALQINDLKTGIASATSAIAGSLGGAAISLDLSDNVIVAPTPKADDGVQVAAPTALSDLITSVNTRFSNLATAIDGLNALPENSRTGWMGDARVATEEFVASWSKSAKETCETARESFVAFITKQRDAVVEADKVK